MLIKLFTKKNKNVPPASGINSTKTNGKIGRIHVSRKKNDGEDDEDDETGFLDGWNLYEEKKKHNIFANSEDEDKEDVPKENDKERKEIGINRDHESFANDKYSTPIQEIVSEEVVGNTVFSVNFNEDPANLDVGGNKFVKPKSVKKSNTRGF